MYVESDKVQHEDLKDFLKSKIDKIKTLTEKLEHLTTQQGVNYKQKKYFISKIDKLSEELGELDFLSPLRSPARHE